MPSPFGSLVDRGGGLAGALPLFCAALALSQAAFAADPAIDPAKLGPPMLVMSPPLPPSAKPRAAAAAPAKRPGPPHAVPAPGKPLIPPAALPVKLDPPPKPRGPLPLETDLQPLSPFEAPHPERGLPSAKSPAG